MDLEDTGGGELLRMRVDAERDVFTARRLARTVGEAAGLDSQDQVRLATALSEVGRDTLAVGGALVEFSLRSDALAVTITADEPLPPAGTGLVAANRLVDVVGGRPGDASSLDGTQTRGPGTRIVSLLKPLPHGSTITDADRDRIRRSLSVLTPISPADELRLQNSELVGALEDLRDKQNELLRLNAELEETNRGVLALYNQLSAELEETNRGVVALYGELDERGIALARANEAKSRFLRNVSHELRTPVNSVLGLARLLLDPTSDPLTGEQRRQVEFILATSADLLALVNDLLDLAKAESGRLDAVIEEVDVATLLAHLDGTMRPLATRTGVNLVVEAQTGAGTLRTDETLLGRVLRNLVSNALKFTERGEVRLTVRIGGDQTASEASDDFAVFVVQDTGIGVSPEDAERIFEDFYQARSHLHGRVRGTGLGLPYARRVCELLGGRLELSSTPGRGSAFTVTLPRDPLLVPAGGRPPGRARGDIATSDAGVVDGANRPAETSLGTGAAGANQHVAAEVRIGTALVVDDDPAFRSAMRSLLGSRVDRLFEAEDGHQALARLRADRPDVVFLDLVLPGLDGAAVLEAMSDDPTLRDVPVVIVTWAELETRGGRAAYGPATAVLSKSGLSQAAIDGALARVRRTVP